MAKLIAYRLLLMLPQLGVILLVAFSLTYLVPGSPAAAVIGVGATPERVAEVEADLGLDGSPLERLGAYIGGAVRGDLGTSYRTQRPVASMIMERIPATLSIVGGGVAVGLMIGVAMGVLAGVRLDRAPDRAVMAATSVFVAVPQFLLGLLLLLVFAITFRWIPVVAYTPLTVDVFAWLRGITLPALSLGVAASALIARQMRAGMAQAVSSTFHDSLAAAGVSPRRFYLRYGIRNALVPVLASVGITFAIMVGASLAVERVFSIPGVGGVMLTAVVAKDFPVVQGGIVIIAMFVIILNIVIDIAYGLVNPQVRPQ